MKQRITSEQLTALSQQGKKKLRAWWKKELYDVVYEPAFTWSYISYKDGYLHLYDRGWIPEEADNGLEHTGSQWVSSCHHPIGTKSRIRVKKTASLFSIGGMDEEDDGEYTPSKRALPLLSIGQMIEFLEYDGRGKRFYWNIEYQYTYDEDNSSHDTSSYTVSFDDLSTSDSYILCDALWAAVKNVLEKP